MRIIQLPIEPLEERYSVQWRLWFEDFSFFDKVDSNLFIDVDTLTSKIQVGSFLDVFGTSFYKSKQISEAVKIIRKKDFSYKTDWIICHDAWNPAILNLSYIRDCANLKFKIAGCLHAGSWDENDFIYKKIKKDWLLLFEKTMLEEVDVFFVATHYHKDLILKKYPEYIHKIKVTGFPIKEIENINVPDKRNDVANKIVFPHRLQEEKQPFLFSKLKEETGLPCDFIITKEKTSSKKQYYELLASSDIGVSFALQETWGIAMQEVVFCNCIPFLPNRLSYKEMYPKEFLYNDFEDLKNKIISYYTYENYRETLYNILHKTKKELLKKGEDSLYNMYIEIIKAGAV